MEEFSEGKNIDGETDGITKSSEANLQDCMRLF